MQSDNERKRVNERVESTAADVKKFKDELHMIKDVIRRQQETKHLELKQEFIEFNTRVEALNNEINMAKAITQ